MSKNYLFNNEKATLQERLDDLMSRLTVNEMIGFLSARQSGVERLGIDAFSLGGEAAHGIVDRSGGHTTVFPQPIGLSATWNPELLKEIGSAIGDEARIFHDKNDGYHGTVMFAPTIDLERDPRWGRTEEAYGEDPYLVGQLSKELIKGMQGDDEHYYKMVTTPKHFFGNNNEYGRTHISNTYDPRNRREYYLKAFAPAYVEARAGSMMTSYSGVNGIPAMEMNELNDIVKGEWNMDGFILCDGGAFFLNVDRYGYHPTYADAIAAGLKQGLDVFLDEKDRVENAAKLALDTGLITEKDIKPAVENTLRVRMRLGHFDANPELNPYNNTNHSLYCGEKFANLALKATEEQMVLLKNAELLPLKPSAGKKIAVIGGLGAENHRDWYAGYAPKISTVINGLSEHSSNPDVTFENGHNHLHIKDTATGLYLTVDELGLIKATAATPGEAELFELEDWGWQANVLRHVTTGMYVGQGDDNLAYSINQGENVITVQNPEYSTHRKEIFDWFIKERIRIYPTANGFNLRSWEDKFLSVDETGTLVANVTPSEFVFETVKNGANESEKLARESDVAIVVVGNHPMLNGREIEDRPSIDLPPAQLDLIKKVSAQNPNTIVLIVGSYPFSINWVNENIPAVIYTSHSTQALGTATANVLFGEADPSGRLSMTWYKHTDDLPSIYDYDVIKGNRTYLYHEEDVLYPFGHGLSYAKFEQTNFATAIENDEIKMSVTVKNTSDRPGTEVVQFYATPVNPSVKRPLKQLIGFKKVTVAAGETQDLTVTTAISQLEFWDVSREKYCLETGQYRFMVGSSSQNITAQTAIQIEGEVVPLRVLHVFTKAENYDNYENIYLDKGRNRLNAVYNKENGWICFKNVDFKDGTHRINLEIKSITSAGEVEIAIDSLDNVVGYHPEVPSNYWENLHISFQKVQGVHDLYVKLTGRVALNGLWLE